MRKGFTLIELLVVVLIIGMLAAVALPQYEKAAEKARVSGVLPLLSSLQQANIVYHMSTGEFADKLAGLDISFETEPCPDGFDEGLPYICTKDFIISYGCPIGCKQQIQFHAYRRILKEDGTLPQDYIIYAQVSRMNGRPYSSTRACEYRPGNKKGEKICKAIAGNGSGCSKVNIDMRCPF